MEFRRESDRSRRCEIKSPGADVKIGVSDANSLVRGLRPPLPSPARTKNFHDSGCVCTRTACARSSMCSSNFRLFCKQLAMGVLSCGSTLCLTRNLNTEGVKRWGYSTSTEKSVLSDNIREQPSPDDLPAKVRNRRCSSED